MVFEKELLPTLNEWLLNSGGLWLLVVAALSATAVVLGLVFQLIRFGPRAALRSVGQVIGNFFGDVLGISPRRVAALAALAVKESIRRRVLYVFVVFALLLAFAGWFLDPRSDNPAKLYLTFLLNAVSFLSLVMAVVLSATSLPADLKNRTIQTVVTKPVRATEIVLGRILGFSFTGTLLLLAMALPSYVFVYRTLSHSHAIDAASMVEVRNVPGALQGRTSSVNGHAHDFTVDAQGLGRTVVEQGHWHRVSSEQVGGQTRYVVGPPEDQLTAKVPVYGQLTFVSRDGTPADKGINVGNEWTYLSYIDGATRAAAIWTFDGVTPDRFPDGLPVEMNLKVFRTYKGDIEKTILGSIKLRRALPPMPATKDETQRRDAMIQRQLERASQPTSEPKNFFVQEYKTDQVVFPRKLNDSSGKEIDLFEVLAPDGRIEVEVQCLQGGQYFGMAQPDVYLRAAYAPFWLNYLKCFSGVWLQMVLVTAFGVMFSTFLSAPVALLATLSVMAAGYFNVVDTMIEYGLGRNLGGGIAESAVRLFLQSNLTTPLESGWGTTFVKLFDAVTMPFLVVVASILPDLNQFNHVPFVANGYDIPNQVMALRLLAALGYFIPLAIVGYLFFRNREVAV